MKGKFIPLIAALVAALASVVPAAAAPPAAMSAQIQRQATLVSPVQVTVSVVVQCPAGAQAVLSVGVSQQQAVGPNTNGDGFDVFICTGANQTRLVDVFTFSGVFTPGNAFAGVLGSTSNNAFAFDERVIAIG